MRTLPILSIMFPALICMSAVVPIDSVAAKKVNQHEIRKMTARYADCIIRKKADLARQAILSNASRHKISKDPKYKRLNNGACLVRANANRSGRMRFSGDMYRYALAEALVRKDFVYHPAAEFKNLPKIKHHRLKRPNRKKMAGNDAESQAYRKGRSKATVRIALSKYGECIVRQNSVASHALLRTEFGSSEETTRFEELKPAMSACLNSEKPLGFTRASLRGLIALNYYRLATLARSDATTTQTNSIGDAS